MGGDGGRERLVLFPAPMDANADAPTTLGASRVSCPVTATRVATNSMLPTVGTADAR